MREWLWPMTPAVSPCRRHQLPGDAREPARPILKGARSARPCWHHSWAVQAYLASGSRPAARCAAWLARRRDKSPYPTPPCADSWCKLREWAATAPPVRRQRCIEEMLFIRDISRPRMERQRKTARGRPRSGFRQRASRKAGASAVAALAWTLVTPGADSGEGRNPLREIFPGCGLLSRPSPAWRTARLPFRPRAGERPCRSALSSERRIGRRSRRDKSPCFLPILPESWRATQTWKKSPTWSVWTLVAKGDLSRGLLSRW